MFQQHQEAITKKKEQMFRSHENSIMQLISGNTTLTNQRLDNLKKEIADLKESLEFTQEKAEEKFSKSNEKITSMERNLFILKKEIEVIQTTKPSWAIEIENKLVGLEDRSRRKNLRINGIKEGKNETWEECEERVNCFLEEKLDMDTSEIWIERAHRAGEKKRGQERQIAVQFNKLDILRSCKKLKRTNFSIFEDFNKETASIRKEKWKEVLKNRKDGKISYLQYKNVIFKERPQVS